MTIDRDKLTPRQVIQRLREGNERFCRGDHTEFDHGAMRQRTASGQRPMAALLGCMDSRAPAEMVFDVGIGDLMNVRVAGNFVDEDTVGCLEYAAHVVGVKGILLMGHTDCGAIRGVCDNFELGNVTQLIRKLHLAVDAVEGSEDIPQPHTSANPAFLYAVTRANVRLGLLRMREMSTVLREMEEVGRLVIEGALYDIKTGIAEFLSE